MMGMGCFLVLAIVKSAAVKIGVHVQCAFFNFVSLGYMPSSGIVGSYGSSIPSVFFEISILSSIVAVSIYIPTNSAKVFPFLHTLSSIYCLWII